MQKQNYHQSSSDSIPSPGVTHRSAISARSKASNSRLHDFYLNPNSKKYLPQSPHGKSISSKYSANSQQSHSKIKIIKT